MMWKRRLLTTTLATAVAALVAMGVNLNVSLAQSASSSPIASSGAAHANGRLTMVLHLSYYFLRDVQAGDQPPSSGACPLCGSPGLINTIVTNANAEFGSHWAVLLNPGDSANFSQFFSTLQILNADHVHFWLDAYTSDIEHYTPQWAYYYQEPSQPLTLQPPYHEAFNVPLSPAQLSTIENAMPNAFVGVRIHEVPYRASNPYVASVVSWIASHNVKIMINGGPPAWNATWEPFILAHRDQTIPLVNNNWIGGLDGNWQWATALYQQGAVQQLGWSTQTFYILPLSKFQVSAADIGSDQVPANPYFLYFAYQYSYGGTLFEVEPDQAIYSTTGALTATGQRIVQFYQWFAHAPAVSPSFQLGQNAYGVIAIRQSGKNRTSWMGPMNLTTASSASSGTTSLTYTVSGLPAGSSALLAIWNGSANGQPETVTVNGQAVPVTRGFQAFARPSPVAFWLGGQDLYVRTQNATVSVTYGPGTVQSGNAPLNLDKGALFRVLDLGGPRAPAPTVASPTATCIGNTVDGTGTAGAVTVQPGQTVFCSADFSAELFPVNYAVAGVTGAQQIGADVGSNENVAALQMPSAPGTYDLVAQYVIAGTTYQASFPVTVP